MTRPVGYLVTAYPAVSHTFIQREVIALRRRGTQVRTYSVHRASVRDVLSADDAREVATTTWLLPVPAFLLLRVLAELLLTHPVAAAGALAAAVRRGAGARGRLWQVFYFVEAIVLRHHCRSHGVRHMHAHFANAAADIARVLADVGNRSDGQGTWSWSFTMHGPTEFTEPERFGLADKVRDAAFIACISRYCRDRLLTIAAGGPAAELVLVRCGLDLDAFPVVDRSKRDGPLRVLCVGRLVPEKGQILLVRAVGQLIEEGVPVHLTLVGDGPSRQELELEVARLGLDEEVRLTGSLGQDDIGAWYAWADVFALLSYAEGLPVVLMEAMATGLPVLTTRVAGIPELVEDGVSGTLLNPGDVAGAVAALRDLAQDASVALAAGAQARRRVSRQHDIDQCVVPLQEAVQRCSMQRQAM